jgi:hypothetical protein
MAGPAPWKHQYVNPLVASILAPRCWTSLTVATGLGAALIVGSVFVAVRQEGATCPSPATVGAPGAPAEQTA